MRESDVALDVARKMGALLAGAGHTAMLSRDSDTAVTIPQRWRHANAWGADAYVSVHVNGHGNPHANGYETFISAAKPQDRALAETVHGAYIRGVKLRDRGVKLDTQTQHAGGLGVLRESSMPAILAELGFVTAASHQYQDVAVLRYFREKMAAALVQGLLLHHGGRRPGGIAAGAAGSAPQPALDISFSGETRSIRGYIKDGEAWVRLTDIAGALGHAATWDEQRRAVSVDPIARA